MMDWMKTHPELVVAFVWPVASGCVSWLYTLADGYPRTHALLTFIAGAGLDLPRMLDGLRRLFGGGPPTGKVVATLALVCLAMTAGCLDARGANDVAHDFQCVLDHRSEPPERIVVACAGLTVEAVVDILATQQRAGCHR